VRARISDEHDGSSPGGGTRPDYLLLLDFLCFHGIYSWMGSSSRLAGFAARTYALPRDI
jgi:hypothetical protein